MGIENQGIRGNTDRIDLIKNKPVSTNEALLEALNGDPDAPFLKDISDKDATTLDVEFSMKNVGFRDLAQFTGDAAVMKRKLEELSRATDDSLRKRVAKEIAELVEKSL